MVATQRGDWSQISKPDLPLFDPPCNIRVGVGEILSQSFVPDAWTKPLIYFWRWSGRRSGRESEWQKNKEGTAVKCKTSRLQLEHF